MGLELSRQLADYGGQGLDFPCLSLVDFGEIRYLCEESPDVLSYGSEDYLYGFPHVL